MPGSPIGEPISANKSSELALPEYPLPQNSAIFPVGAPAALNLEGEVTVLATQIRQKDGIFYFASVPAKDLLGKVRFISRFYGEGEEIAPVKISHDDEIASSPSTLRSMKVRT